jgi:hypothetical protein
MDENNENLTQENSSSADPETPFNMAETDLSAETTVGNRADTQTPLTVDWLGVLFFILMLALGVFLGYRQGIARLLAREQTTVVECGSRTIPDGFPGYGRRQ